MDTNFIFSCSTQYLTSLLRSLMRYKVEHSKIKYLSTRGHVISSISINGKTPGGVFQVVLNQRNSASLNRPNILQAAIA